MDVSATSVLTFIKILESGGSALAKINDSSKSKNGKIKKFIDLIQRGKQKVLIYGAGGVGKSTFWKLITKEDISIEELASYNSTTLPQKNVVPGFWLSSLFDSPGQEAARKGPQWNQLEKSIKTGELNGIVHVVSYGYHAFGSSYESIDSKFDYKSVNIDDFLIKYTKERRSEELRHFSKLMEHLMGLDSPIWILTLINKAVVWWDDRREVAKHYEIEDGVFSDELARLQKRVGANQLTYSVCAGSLVASNFKDAEGKLIWKTAAGFDDLIQIRSKHLILNQFDILMRG